jgi:hypothetical protein
LWLGGEFKKLGGSWTPASQSCSGTRPKAGGQTSQYFLGRLSCQARFEVAPEAFPVLLRERGAEGPGWSLAEQERRPVVLEVGEGSWRVECANLDRLEPRCREQLFEGAGLAQREPLCLGEAGMSGTDRPPPIGRSPTSASRPRRPRRRPRSCLRARPPSLAGAARRSAPRAAPDVDPARPAGRSSHPENCSATGRLHRPM